jgi:hypothetical protein
MEARLYHTEVVVKYAALVTDAISVFGESVNRSEGFCFFSWTPVDKVLEDGGRHAPLW